MTPTFFLKIINGNIVLWNYLTHEQFQLDHAHLERIQEICTGSLPDLNSPIDQTILASKCLDVKDPDDWGWDCLSRIFHIGTQIRLNEGQALPEEDAYRGYIDYCQSISNKIPEPYVKREGPTFRLPPPDTTTLADSSLLENLLRRQSFRSFLAEPIKIQDVSNALWLCFGAVHGSHRSEFEEFGIKTAGYRRTSPSGGSMHPSEPYLVSLRIEGLPPGIYHYQSNDHQLTQIKSDFSAKELGPLLCSQTFANDLSYGIFITSRFDKLWWKYPHSRAYRVALLDIGCLVQTFQLVCTAQSFQSWPTGYFIDTEINKLLGVDENKESTMFFVGAGIGDSSMAREALAILQEKSRA